ncbi:MAG: CapA family protein, partial [Cyanobacteria bacterium J06632_3]
MVSSPQNLAGASAVLPKLSSGETRSLSEADYPAIDYQLDSPLDTAETQSSPLPAPAPQLGFAGLDVKQLAAEGYFQAIAYWLNEPLVSQNVYAQVLADKLPGRLKVLVEFERPPQPQRLMGFVCDRLYQLNSNVIEGVYLIARAIGSGKTDWEQRIRIPTATQRRPAKVTAIPSEPPVSAGEQRQPPLIQPLIHESPRSKIARKVVRSQFKFFRAALISGTAIAAFFFGGLTELILSDRLAASVENPAEENITDMTPWYGDIPDAMEVALHSENRPSNRGRTVEAALETVAVIPHTDIAQPDDPTITMVFGGELGLNDFVFEEAESLDQLFSDLTIYQQADVAMVGLSEPLATPSTTLQEDFYHRTRPQAVQALKAGGIDIVNLANEGTLTYGARGLDETLRTLDQQGIYRVGAGRDQKEAHRPEILEVKGQRIAYLGYNPEAVKAAKDDKAGVALTNSKERSHIQEDIRAIRSQVDWIVVNYRWGDMLGTATENSEEKSDASADASALAAMPEDWQKSLARDAVDAGADLVVGYHPSQIQGAEIYRDRAIAYSLGDFVFGEAPLEDHDTAALRVSLRNYQMKVEFLPVSVRNSQIQMATGDRGTAILRSIRDASKSFEQPLKFPAVLDAQPTFTPSFPTSPNIEPDTEPEASFSSPASSLSLPPSTSADQQIDPIPPDQLPTDYQPLLDELEAVEYAEPAPNVLLRESDALFMPTEGESQSGLTEDEISEGEISEGEISEGEISEGASDSSTDAHSTDEYIEHQTRTDLDSSAPLYLSQFEHVV